jgi:hypothetical protein
MGYAMRNAWASFILYGDPNVNNSYFASAGINWKPYGKRRRTIKNTIKKREWLR